MKRTYLSAAHERLAWAELHHLSQHARAALDKATEGCLHEFTPFTKGCSKCGEPYSTEGASHE